MFPSLSARRRWRLSRRRLSITCRTSLLDSDCVWWAKSSTLCSTKLHGAADTSSPEQEASASCSPPSSFACSRPMVAWASMSSRWSWITSLSFSSITVAHSGWRIIWKVASWCSATNSVSTKLVPPAPYVKFCVVIRYLRWAAEAGSHRGSGRSLWLSRIIITGGSPRLHLPSRLPRPNTLPPPPPYRPVPPKSRYGPPPSLSLSLSLISRVAGSAPPPRASAPSSRASREPGVRSPCLPRGRRHRSSGSRRCG